MWQGLSEIVHLGPPPILRSCVFLHCLGGCGIAQTQLTQTHQLQHTDMELYGSLINFA